RPTQEVAAQDFMPDLANLFRLREEAVPTHVEAEAPKRDGAGQATDPLRLLQHDRLDPGRRQLAGRGEPARSRPEECRVSVGSCAYDLSPLPKNMARPFFFHHQGVTGSKRSRSNKSSFERGYARM